MANTRLDFASAIDTWTIKTEKRMEFVFRNATGRLFDEVYERTPVKDNFLRGTFGASTEVMPVIDRDATGWEGYSAAVQPYDLVTSTAKLGETIYGGFVAVYARRINYGFHGEDKLGRHYNQGGAHMVELSAQNWDSHVSGAIKEAKSVIK